MQNDSHEFKEQLAKSRPNMCNICQTGAGISKNVTFGEQATTEASRWSTTSHLGGSRKVTNSIDTIGKIVVKPLGKRRGANNLLNNNMYIYIYIYIDIREYKYNNNNNLMGGRSASTCEGTPYGGPVIIGKSGITLAPSRLGFSRSPLPALCRQDTSYAWRPRLWRIHDRK